MSSSLYAQECQLVERNMNELNNNLNEILLSFVDVIEIRKNSYITQLKKMKEVSNNATRNVIQTCKLDATTALNNLKLTLDREKEKEFFYMKQQLNDSELKNDKLIQQINELTNLLDNERSLVKEQNYKMERITSDFVKTTEDSQKSHFTKLIENQKKYEEDILKERQKWKLECEEQIKTNKLQNEVIIFFYNLLFLNL